MEEVEAAAGEPDAPAGALGPDPFIYLGVG
jgi:hypothetical protein